MVYVINISEGVFWCRIVPILLITKIVGILGASPKFAITHHTTFYIFFNSLRMLYNASHILLSDFK